MDLTYGVPSWCPIAFGGPVVRPPEIAYPNGATEVAEIDGPVAESESSAPTRTADIAPLADGPPAPDSPLLSSLPIPSVSNIMTTGETAALDWKVTPDAAIAAKCMFMWGSAAFPDQATRPTMAHFFFARCALFTSEISLLPILAMSMVRVKVFTVYLMIAGIRNWASGCKLLE